MGYLRFQEFKGPQVLFGRPENTRAQFGAAGALEYCTLSHTF
jgi:hypothetical protein